MSTTTQTTARRAGVAAALAAGLALSGAGVAAATTPNAKTSGTTVSVTFTVDANQPIDACAAAITPIAHTASLLDKIRLLDVAKLTGDNEIKVLGGATGPLAAPTAFGPATVSLPNVQANTYTLAMFCASWGTYRQQQIVVGDPIQAALGSLGTMSAGDNLTSGSALLTGGGK